MEKSRTAMFPKFLFLLFLFSKIALAASINDDAWLDQVVTFVKVNLEGNFAFLIILIGLSVAFVGAMFGGWGLALKAFAGAILIGSITFWAQIGQTMGQSLN